MRPRHRWQPQRKGWEGRPNLSQRRLTLAPQPWPFCLTRPPQKQGGEGQKLKIVLGWIGGGIVHVAGGIVVALLSYVKTGALTLPTPIYYTYPYPYSYAIPLRFLRNPYSYPTQLDQGCYQGSCCCLAGITPHR